MRSDPSEGHPEVIRRPSEGHPKIIRRSSEGHPKEPVSANLHPTRQVIDNEACSHFEDVIRSSIFMFRTNLVSSIYPSVVEGIRPICRY